MRGKLDLDPTTVRKARTLARKVGRPIVKALDPKAAARQILSDMSKALSALNEGG